MKECGGNLPQVAVVYLLFQVGKNMPHLLSGSDVINLLAFLPRPLMPKLALSVTQLRSLRCATEGGIRKHRGQEMM